MALSAVVALGSLLVASAAVAAPKGVSWTFGADGSGPGQFGTNSPRGVAVYEATGQIFAVDGGGHRVNRYDSEGNFELQLDSTFIPDPFVAFNNPGGVAVDQDNGWVYVSERNNRRVLKFDVDGDFIGEFGGTGAAEGQFGTGSATGAATSFNGHLAIDGDGFVYVADPVNKRVQKFAPGTAATVGAFVGTFGWGVDDGTAELQVCASGCQIGTAGAGAGQFGAGSPGGPTRVAVDSAGDVYALEPGTSNNRVQKFDLDTAVDGTISAVTSVTASWGAGVAGSYPHAIAIDGDDHVYVARRPPDGATATEVQVPELLPDGTPVADSTHGVGAGIGVGATAANTNHFAGLAVGSDGQAIFVPDLAGDGRRVLVLDDVSAPTAELDPDEPVTDVGPDRATFNGTVNPGGGPTGYRFEYSDDDGASWTSFPVDDADVGDDTGDVPVANTVTGLRPNTTYLLRLVASQTYGPAFDTSPEATFTTQAAPPTIAPFATADADTTNARLYGRVNPNSQPTSYHFEWGVSSAYGNVTPPASAGAGGDSVLATASIAGLQPNTAYHYRIVASNPSGSSEGGDHTFTTGAPSPSACLNDEFRQGAAALLPGCRAYEQVSPTDKNGFDIQSVGEFAPGEADPPEAGGAARPDGLAVAFRSEGAFGDAAFGGNFRQFYLARRSATGWTTNALMPRVTGDGTSSYGISAFDRDFTQSLLNVSNGSIFGSADEGQANLYRRVGPDGPTSIVVGSPTGFTSPAGTSAAASADLDHVVFATGSLMTDEDGQPASAAKIYEASDGNLRLVSREPGTNAPFQIEAAVGSSSIPRSQEGAVSNDGRHIFFTAPEATPTSSRVIYRRSDGTITELATPDKRSSSDPNTWGKHFHLGTGDGNRLFFTSPQQLTDDANQYSSPSDAGDLYRYDFDADRLVNLSAGTPGASEANALGVLGASGEGDRVYFAAMGEVVPGEGAAGPKLYLWEDDGSPTGTVQFIATLSSQDSDNWFWDAKKRSYVTADGSQLAFESRAAIHGSTEYDSAGTAQVYLYDADADDGDGDLVCVSCMTAGVAAGPALVPTRENGFQRERPRFLSDDGRQVFFTSPDALEARDGNGKLDAYLWQRSSQPGASLAGGAELISTGRSGHDSYFHGASSDGTSAFFRTRERLVPQDVDLLADLYVAKVGGGLIAQQDETAEPCEGDTCQGPPQGAPAPRDKASEDFQGKGNLPASAPRRASRLLRITRRQRMRLARGQRVGLRLRVAGAGRVAVVARARVGKRRRVVARGSVRARKAGQVRVAIRMSRLARRHLRRGRALRVVLRVNAPGGARPKTVAITVRRPR